MIKWKKEKGTDLSVVGLIVTLGIVYGDLGTSPLYTMQAIMRTLDFTSYNFQSFVIGGLSALFWTLTLQTTIKYVFITLKANNKGEGGIFLLFTLIRNKHKWIYFPAIIGACALLGDGVITPAMTVTSAVEGVVKFFPDLNVVLIVVTIISILFFAQQFGTYKLGKYFGPIMFIWFSLLLILGIFSLSNYPTILKALNPIYAIQLIINYPSTLVFLGAVFLVTTGAEALYSDLGHCGIKNIRITWIFVKLSLILNYFGQGAWIINHESTWNSSINPFFAIMPNWLLPYGVIIATLAAIIASQALISGSYTIVSEAISLNFFPKIKIKYPTNVKGQMYIPFVNKTLWILCILVVLFFQSSAKMEAAYGLAITIAMLMTSLLLMYYLKSKRGKVFAIITGIIFITIEITFLIANLTKFTDGGWVSLAIMLVFISIMFTWHRGSNIESLFVKYLSIDRFKDLFVAISKDESIPKYSTNLVYLTKSNSPSRLEHLIFYSILINRVKRADKYWFLHVNHTDDPKQLTYEVYEIVPDKVIRIDLNIGFKVEPKINMYFREITSKLIKENRIDMRSHYQSLKDFNVLSDIRFIVINQIKNNDYDFNLSRQILMNYFYLIKQVLVNKIKSLQLDQTRTKVESIPFETSKRIFQDEENIKINPLFKTFEDFLVEDNIHTSYQKKTINKI
ncbi:MAG: KUP/HAK/KT family potassium transporter [Bacteroidales bacterium]|nr:KUP/HAK/KT family potassium transporter [Bacteroidales bacterium]MDD4068490.1 KUP/HAK/KT family potassium transporter [Bacteroidales bacterium]